MKEQKWKWLWLTCICLIGVIIVFRVLSVYQMCTASKTEIKDVDLKTSADIFFDGLTVQTREGMQIDYYDSISISINEFQKEEFLDDAPLFNVDDEIIQISNNDYIWSIFPGSMMVPFQKLLPCTESVIFRVEGKKISYPIYRWNQGMETSFFGCNYRYYEEDRIAKGIVDSYHKSEMTKLVNNDVPIYYGVGIDEEIEAMTIMGKKPTEIIPFQFEEKIYYLWYYLDANEFTQLFDTNIDINADGLREVIECFDIKLER